MIMNIFRTFVASSYKHFTNIYFCDYIYTYNNHNYFLVEFLKGLAVGMTLDFDWVTN